MLAPLTSTNVQPCPTARSKGWGRPAVRESAGERGQRRRGWPGRGSRVAFQSPVQRAEEEEGRLGAQGFKSIFRARYREQKRMKAGRGRGVALQRTRVHTGLAT
eukprot:718697-Prymnesium_polylepis.2